MKKELQTPRIHVLEWLLLCCGYIASETIDLVAFVATGSPIRDNTKPSRMDLYSELNPANQPLWIQTHSQNAKTGLTGSSLIKYKNLWPDPPDMKEMQKSDAGVKGAVSVNATMHLKTHSTVRYSLRRSSYDEVEKCCSINWAYARNKWEMESWIVNTYQQIFGRR